MAVWYVARPDELLIDLDDAMRPTRADGGGKWIELFFRRRLRDAMEAGKLRVCEAWLAPSTSKRHYHAIVRLARELPAFERMIWQMHLGSDLYRGRADAMRAARGLAAPSLLIRADAIPGFYRAPDEICECKGKHVTSENPTCDVWRRLRGASPWELFGPSSPGVREYGVPLPVGRVPLDLILRRRLADDEPQQRGNDGRKERRQMAAGETGAAAGQ